MPQALHPPIAPEKPWLAPLAGWSDLPFRLLCREYGAAVCCTEMVSAKGLVYEQRGGGRATRELLASTHEDSPTVAQLFGDDPAFMAEAVHLLAAGGWRYVDCNMGCSVPKVTRAGAGAALLRAPEQALRVAEAMLAAARPAGMGVGFKLRLGWDDTRTVFALAHALQEAGAAWLTLHPRTARQAFTGQADWAAVAELGQTLRVPLIASGDLWTAEDGVRCLRETGATGVMYARGALRDPAIFARHRLLLRAHDMQTDTVVHTSPEAEAPAVLLARIRRHAELARCYSSPHTALLKMRTAVPRYVRHMEGARALRQAVIACRSWEDVDSALERFFV